MFRNMFWIVLFLTAASSASAESSDTDQIPIVGLNALHQSAVQTVSISDYQSSIGSAFSAVQDSITPALEAHASQKKPSWSVRTIAIGIAVSAQIGIGPIFSVSATPHLRLIYSNSKSPVYPD
jgi:hypothetical protein